MLGQEQLALAEDGLRRGVEPVVVELDEGAPQEREAVEDLPAGQDHPGIPGEPEVPPHLRFLVRAPEREAEAVRRATRWRTETSKSPMFQPVRTSGSAARRWGQEAARQARSFGTSAPAAPSGRPASGSDARPDKPDPVAAVARRGDGVKSLAVDAGLDVEREHAEAGHEVGRLERGFR